MKYTLFGKSVRALIRLFPVLFLLIALNCPAADAASKASINNKADALYMKKVQRLKKDVKSVWYKFTDITGDDIHEAVIFGKAITGSGNYWKIYTYKGGKTKLLFDGGEYGLDKLVVYKKTKSFYYHRAGHGWEATIFYQLKNGKYKQVAGKGRSFQGVRPGKWSYNNGKKAISKSAYNKLIRKYKRGKAAKMNPSKWPIELVPENIYTG